MRANEGCCEWSVAIVSHNVVLPHFPWSRFVVELQEAIRRSRPVRFIAQITESDIGGESPTLLNHVDI